ncbi:hypothetical protein OIU79_011712 [Salix purpurea]|uniref:Uncharacterized protein n=1 Tax=Salix purpurea TaxID=77065 RepID=A0A9Q0T2G6_SALPP|nr:hypothetical protein OIU79_011712 [Salix purpurea]
MPLIIRYLPNRFSGFALFSYEIGHRIFHVLNVDFSYTSFQWNKLNRGE